jgi:PKD repeat protein
VYYKNIGNASTGTGFWIGLFANGILVDEKHIGELNKNSSGVVLLEGENYFGQIGYYKIYIDYRNDIYETNESNNEKIINTQLPDLTIISAKKENNGKQIWINYTNIGNVSVANFSISLYVDDIKKYSISVNTLLKPNESIEETLNWDISNVSGDSEVYIMIDSENNFIELNEWNNIYYLQGNYEPYAYFNYNINGTTVRFDASPSKDIDGSIVEYIWDFGDNNTGSGISPSHQYNEEGMYKVILTVKDNGGKTDTTFRYIYIKDSNNGGNSIPIPIYIQLLILLSTAYFASSIMRGLK